MVTILKMVSCYSFSALIKKCFLFCQVPAAAAQGSRNFHFSIYGKKNNAKVSDDVSYFWSQAWALAFHCSSKVYGFMIISSTVHDYNGS